MLAWSRIGRRNDHGMIATVTTTSCSHTSLAPNARSVLRRALMAYYVPRSRRASALVPISTHAGKPARRLAAHCRRRPEGAAWSGAMADLFSGIIGQPRAVAGLRAAVANPVHAYMLVGQPGSGKRLAALAFAAALLCPDGGCGSCGVCQRARHQVHPDVVVVEREGASISVAQAREIQRLAVRSPNEGRRKVLVLVDFHLVREAGPTLLKIVEEPPLSTIFVILAEHVPPELVTIASRCVQIAFSSLGQTEIVDALVAEGTTPEAAAQAAEYSGGRLDRARLLVSDPGYVARREAWAAIPLRLDGTGATVARIAVEVDVLLDAVATGPLATRHAAEVAALEERAKQSGERGAGRKDLTDRHKREVRRARTDELRSGLAVLAGAYRDALASGSGGRESLEALGSIQAAAASLGRNPNEALLLQRLLLRLPGLAGRRQGSSG